MRPFILNSDILIPLKGNPFKDSQTYPSSIRTSLGFHRTDDRKYIFSDTNELSSAVMSEPSSPNIAVHKVEDEKFLFDSVAVHFNLVVFIKQLLYHITYPFGLIFVPNLTAQFFDSLHPLAIIWGHIPPIFMWITIISYVMMQYSNSAQFQHFKGCVWYPIFFYLLHRCTVSIKYASLSNTEYARYMDKSNDLQTILTYSGQLQLASAWGIVRNYKTVSFLLVASALKVGARIDKLKFCLDDPQQSSFANDQFQAWKKFALTSPEVGDHIVSQPNGTYAMTAFDVCCYVVKNSELRCNRYIEMIYYMSYCVAIFFTAIPFFGFLQLYGLTASWTTIYLVFSSWVTLQFAFAVITFINVAAFDILRLETAQRILHKMIRLSDLNYDVDFSMTASRKKSKQTKSTRERELGGNAALMMMQKLTAGGGSRRFRTASGKEVTDVDNNSSPEQTAVRHNDAFDHAENGNMSIQSNAATTVPLVARKSLQPSCSECEAADRVYDDITEFIPVVRRNSITETATNQHENVDNTTPNNRISIRQRAFTVAGIDQYGTPEGDDSVLQNEVEFDDSDSNLPRISFRYQENLNSWCWIRLVLLNFGTRFTARLEIFTVLTCIANCILMAAALSIIFSASNGQARVDAFSVPIFRQAIVSIGLFSGFLIVYTYSAANINWELDQQRATLASHVLRVRERIIDLTNAQTERREERKRQEKLHQNKLQAGNHVDDELEKNERKQETANIVYWINVERAVVCGLQAVKANNDLRMFYVLGLPANYKLPVTISSTAFSFFATIIATYSAAASAASGVSVPE